MEDRENTSPAPLSAMVKEENNSISESSENNSISESSENNSTSESSENNLISESSEKIPEEYHPSQGRLDLSFTGGIFRPYSLTIYAGEDIIEKVSLFCWCWSVNVFIVSAVGSIACVTIRDDDSTKEKELNGAFRIVSLAGNVSMDMPSDDDAGYTLMIALADENFSVFHGYVSDTLIAATDVKIMMFAFTPPPSPSESDEKASQKSSSTVESPLAEIDASGTVESPETNTVSSV